MSKKQHEPPADDWAGLAQNLFGIDLDQSGGDDDLLDKDMFKVEIPPPPQPAAPAITDEAVTFSESAAVPAAEPLTPAPVTAIKPSVPKAKVAVPSSPVPRKSKIEEDPFGAGILEEEEVVAATAELATIEAENSDEGLTLPEDTDEEGLTLASDFDDGLTLPPDHEDDGLTLASDDDGLAFASEDDSPRDEAIDSDEDSAKEGGDSKPAARSGGPRMRHPRRSREDAYWDMLENWEWEEITDSDSPRGEGSRSSSRGGGRDRGSRGGRGRDRDRGPRREREERSRGTDSARAEDRPRREEPRPAESAATTPHTASGDRPARPRRDDRPREDRGPRSERRPDREGRREEPQSAAAKQSAAPVNAFDDFGSGIFEESSPVPQSVAPKPEHADRLVRDEAVAQSSQAADAVLQNTNRTAGGSVRNELVWPEDDDNSDVRPVPAGSVVETSILPTADVAGDSDRTVSPSDVEPLDESEQRSRRPRRRRRRGGGAYSERTAPPDGNEGTTFDLSEALAGEGETPDFIPSAANDDSALSTESSEEATDRTTGDDQPSPRRGSRRRRRRRPSESESADATASANGNATAVEGEASEFDDSPKESEPDLKPIAYSNVPSWEEAIRYLLEPHLVGRNLGPDDGDEGLASDPRGSGGAEPVSAPPPPRRRRGGGRGRRP
jgi:hypothetical protein